MRLTALALDYDGTIAEDGVLGAEMRGAIAEARASGIKVILVTGRILGELRRLAGDLRFVDAVVAENGAVLAFPETGVSRLLAEPPPAHFRKALDRRGIQRAQRPRRSRFRSASYAGFLSGVHARQAFPRCQIALQQNFEFLDLGPK